MPTRSLSDFQRFADAEPVSRVTETETITLPVGWECLSFDQSLAATGFVHLRVGTTGPYALDVRTIKAPSGLNLKSNTDALIAGEALYEAVYKIFVHRIQASEDRQFFVAHETPPNMGKVPGQGMSSIVAAMALRAATKQHGLTVEVVARPTWAKFVCGNAKAEKKEAHAALPAWGISGAPVTNEGQRDALCIALTALSRRA